MRTLPLALALGLSGAVPTGAQSEPAPAGNARPASESFRLDDETELVMAGIPAGTFTMGSAMSEEALTARYGTVVGDPSSNALDAVRREVTLSRDYLMGATEVTVGQFRAFVRATEYETEAELAGGAMVLVDGRWTFRQGVDWRAPGVPTSDQHPVTMVTWEDARVFCFWLSEEHLRTFRLPTEAEWEYACRAGSKTEFCFGDESATLVEYGWTIENCAPRLEPRPVGRLKPNAWGLFDVHGNVFEWCADWFASFSVTDPITDPGGPAQGPGRVVRGGSYSRPAGESRSTHRAADRPTLAEGHFGFRVACEMD